MQKIKNLLHHNTDANHNGIPDSQERGVGGLNDRNHNGIPDSQERLGQTGVVGGLNDRNHNGIPDSQERGAHHNPLDRNHDGKVNLQDLKSNKDRNHNGIPDNQERSGLVGGLNDRNHNGVPDNLERGQTGLVGGLNDRNMNGIPDNLERGTTGLTREAPVQVQLVQKDVVVHEHIHPVEKEEIQPVIYREREQLDVKQITQQLHETQIQPTLVQQRELAAEVRAPIVERGAPIQENLVLPSTDRDATMRSVQVHAPIVNETIKRTVIEEIQPVLERDVIQSTLIQETKNIYEKVIEAPTVYRETVVVQDRGVNGGSLAALSAQGFNLGGFSNDRNMNGIPDNLERNSQFGNDRNMNGIPDNLEGGMRHNPLDRNHDGRVNLQDLKSTDRNHNGIPDSQERLGLGQQGLAGGLNDRNHNGIPDSQERLGQQGMMGQRTANPLDRNNDGRVDLKDLTGQQAGQQGLMGQQRTANPLDRNNDGKVDLKDALSGSKATPLAGQAPLRTL